MDANADAPVVEVETTIAASPDKVWAAMTNRTSPMFMGATMDTDWQPGSDWKLMIPDGRVGDSGKILEIEPGRKLSVSWENQFMPELKAEGHSTLTWEIEPMGEMVRLTLVHEMDRPASKLIQAVSGGWPMILASVKSLLETGEPLPGTSEWPEGH